MNTISTTVDPEVEYPNVEKMINKLAWAATQRYGIPFEETRSEAVFGFMKACRRFKPDRNSKFSSYCYFCITCRLRSLGMGEAEQMPTVEVNEEILGEAPPIKSPFMDFLEGVSESLSSDAKEILSLLLEAPKELADEVTTTPKGLLRKVRKHLQRQGKNRESLDAAQEELHSMFRTVWAN